MKNPLYLLIFSLLLLWSSLLTAAQDNFVWQCSVTPDGSTNTAEIVCTVKKNCYLYESAVAVNIRSSGSIELLEKPVSVKGDDDTSIYPAGRHRWIFRCNGKIEAIDVEFQGCIKGAASGGDLCLMPETLQLWRPDEETTSPADPAVNIAEAAAMPENLRRALSRFTLQNQLSGLTDAESLCKFIRSDTSTVQTANDAKEAATALSSWGIVLLVLLGGLGLNLTPCVLPMIPVNLAIIGAGSGCSSRWRGFRRGTAYALGITLAYGVLGAAAALSGSSFGSLNSSAIFNWIIGAVFALLGLGMLGVYELDLSRFGSFFKFNSTANGIAADLSAAAMGAVSALLAGACVAPVVISVIVLAGKLYSEGSTWAIFLPFALGLAMALPWPLLGAGLSVLPPPGSWMVRVKQIFGVFILLMALYYGYLGWNLRSGAFDQQQELDRLAAELDSAAQQQQSVLIDCWASWCKNCTALEKVLATEKVQQALKQANIKVIRFQAERLNDPAVKSFMTHFQLPGLPSLLLLKDN